MSQGHDARIANVYDSFVTTELDLPFFRAQADEYGGDILERMAGTGRLTVPLIEAGFVVEALCGNYDRSAFDPLVSPFLIWLLRKQR